MPAFCRDVPSPLTTPPAGQGRRGVSSEGRQASPRKSRAAALVLVLAAGAGCVRESTMRAQEASPAPLPSASQAQRLPPIAAAPELAVEPEPGTEKGARDFVTGFLQSRMARNAPQAGTYLSANARDQYAKGEGGLALTGSSKAGFAGWELVSAAAADANSYEVKVRLSEPGNDLSPGISYVETLFIGPGPDFEGRQRPWVVRGARVEKPGAP